MASQKTMRWLPLESNPEVMNKFIYELGVSKEWAFTDVYGLDADLLAMIPRPVAAVLLLFPITAQYEQHFTKENEELQNKPQIVSDKLFFIRQTIQNACGTIGLVHAICNNVDRIEVGDGFFQKYMISSQDKSADERATLLEEDETLSATHEEMAQEGQTEAPPVDEDVNLHFICFVEKEGHLYELDGRKSSPINHGATTSDLLLEDAAKVVQQFMNRDPDNLRFTVIALTQASEAEQ